jgi:hypothetical protein
MLYVIRVLVYVRYFSLFSGIAAVMVQVQNKTYEVNFVMVFQPVRTFFHTNKSTCGEWLTRIRSAVVVVAIHAGQATTAIRHGHCMLQDMADANNTQVC